MIETSDFDRLLQMVKSRQAQRSPSQPTVSPHSRLYNLKRNAPCTPAAGAAERHLGDNRKSQDSRVPAFPHAGVGISPGAPPARNDARPNR